MLKITFCIPRPWLLSSALQPVESAVGRATGFSFPSSHTVSAVCIYGGLACGWKKFRAAAPVLILLVAASRLYLGVHTPLDVGVALVVGILSLAVAGAVLKLAGSREQADIKIFAAGMLLCLLGLVYTHFRAAAYGNTELFLDAYKAVGGGLGFFCAWLAEKRLVRFECGAPLWFQAVKAVAGVLLMLLLQQGLKTPFIALFGTEAGNLLRYFIVIFFAIAAYPWLFMRIGRRLCRKSSSNNSQ